MCIQYILYDFGYDMWIACQTQKFAIYSTQRKQYLHFNTEKYINYVASDRVILSNRSEISNCNCIYYIDTKNFKIVKKITGVRYCKKIKSPMQYLVIASDYKYYLFNNSLEILLDVCTNNIVMNFRIVKVFDHDQTHENVYNYIIIYWNNKFNYYLLCNSGFSQLEKPELQFENCKYIGCAKIKKAPEHILSYASYFEY